MSEQDELKILRAKVRRLSNTVATLIAWMAGSANSPISGDEARELLRKLEADDE